jgi:hypothetical protein
MAAGGNRLSACRSTRAMCTELRADSLRNGIRKFAPTAANWRPVVSSTRSTDLCSIQVGMQRNAVMVTLLPTTNRPEAPVPLIVTVEPASVIAPALRAMAGESPAPAVLRSVPLSVITHPARLLSGQRLSSRLLKLSSADKRLRT